MFHAAKEEEENRPDEEEEEIGGLFKRTSKTKASGGQHSVHAVMDDLDTSRYIPPVLQEWGDREVCLICFPLIFSNCIGINSLGYTELCICHLVFISVIPCLLSVIHKDIIFLSQVRALVRDCFVTGDWKDRDAQTLLKMDDEDNLYGDFEDLETGVKFSAETDEKQQQEGENEEGNGRYQM